MKSHLEAYELARERLKGVDIKERCRKSGARLVKNNDNETFIHLPLLNGEYKVSFPGGEVETACRRNGVSAKWRRGALRTPYSVRAIHELPLLRTQKDVSLWEKIIILHYILFSRGTPHTGKMISYNEVPDGKTYYPVFMKRSTRPILKAFGKNPSLLIKAAECLGGETMDLGDCSVRIHALPRVDIITIIWGGDDELSPEANMVFDSSIVDYLPAEDITVLCSMIAITLIKQVR